MIIRKYDAEKDFDIIKSWITDERTHKMWCANLISYPLEKNSFNTFLSDIAEKYGDTPFVACDGEDVIGFFSYSLNSETSEGMFRLAMINNKQRGKGYGSEMLKAALEYVFEKTSALSVQINVFSVNTAAKKCYLKTGFKERTKRDCAFSFNGESWGRCNMVIYKKDYCKSEKNNDLASKAFFDPLNCSIRRLDSDEYRNALDLVMDVFMKYEASDYGEEGVTEFYNSIHDENYLAELIFYGAYAGRELAGIIAVRGHGTHIALFFVKEEYQHYGIGRRLFNEALKNCSSEKITANSSPYAFPIYHALGFSETDKEQTVNGIRYIPMEYTKEKN